MAWEVPPSCHEKVLHLCEIDEGLTEPHEFAERAWDAYVDCLQEENYYFSVDELLLICALAKVDVAVFKQNGTDLELAGGVFTNGGPLVCTKLYVPNDTRRARTHFERLVSTTQIQKLSEVTEEKRNEASLEGLVVT